MATISKGYTFGASEQVTNAKLHALIDSATITGIVNADIDDAAGIVGTKFADVDGGKLTGLANISSGAGKIPAANLPIVDTYAAKGANSDITSLSGLTTPLSVAQGGTGATAAANAASGVVVLDASSKLPAVDGSQLTGIVGGGYTNMQVFTSSGTWTKPAGVTSVFVKVVGGGGAGGSGGSSNEYSGGGGGGSGGYSEGIVAVTGNVTVTVGSAGGTSSFAGSTTPQATGGSNGGTGGSSGAAGGAPGVGSAGTLNLYGSYGEDSAPMASNLEIGGHGGVSILGGAGRGGLSGANGVAGYANSGSGGGGGGHGSTSGGAGATGVVIVYWNE